MTVRTAEILFAVFLALCSIGIMFKSTDGLSITWVPGTGPGSGVWPFYLSAGMLAACLMTIWRWFRRATPESRNEELFMSAGAMKIVGITVVALTLLLAGAQTIGLYFSMALFLFFYLKIMGRHGWPLSIVLSLATPIALFFFFEGALLMPLPKGWSEPLFYPLYDLIY